MRWDDGVIHCLVLAVMCSLLRNRGRGFCYSRVAL